MVEDVKSKELGYDMIVSSFPEQSDWVCHLFGSGEDGISWRPQKGQEPCWFWRTMQWIIFGNKWVKLSNRT
jgi:hypothetical protein